VQPLSHHPFLARIEQGIDEIPQRVHRMIVRFQGLVLALFGRLVIPDVGDHFLDRVPAAGMNMQPPFIHPGRHIADPFQNLVAGLPDPVLV